MSVTVDRFTAAGDEAGTVPGDRLFRPDVQGLRAVAILLVVLYHADIPGISGGYIGVDVFFVISGFVITGVLLREREGKGRTSLLNFYGRRARRIIPAASLVIVVTAVAAYHYLGSLTGHETAVDGRWAALFLANFHFAASETNYLASQQPPSALQNFWSLAVEEQFYIVYPTIFLLTARFARRMSLHARLTCVLLAIIVASYAYSIVFTSTNAPSAFFSPLTRAWELALGGLIAVSGQTLRRVPPRLAALLSWLGLGAIAVASTTLTSASVYPGALVAIPVVGAGLVIAGGAAQPVWGVESLLRQKPFQLLGLISYSLYLWHWPILVIATQIRGATSLPVWQNVLLLLGAALLAIITYRVIENPVRHARRLIQRRWASVILGVFLVCVTLIVTTYEEHRPVFGLGSLGSVASASRCPSPAPSAVSQLRASYTSSRPQTKRAADSKDQSVVVVGDSTSCTLLPGLKAVGPSYGLAFENGSVIGCGVVSGEIAPRYFNGANLYARSNQCQSQANGAESAAIDRFHPSLIFWLSTEESKSIVAGGKILSSPSPEWKSVMLQRMDKRVRQFVATGAKVVLALEPPPVHGGSQTQPNAGDIKYEQMNSLLKKVAAQYPRTVATVDLAQRVCPSGPPCPYLVHGYKIKKVPGETVDQQISETLRPDEIHYSALGSLWVARWLVPLVAAAEKNLS